MLSGLIGLVFILFGVLSLLFPESLRRSMRRKAVWKLRRYFFIAAVSFGILLISAGWKQEGILPKLLMCLGVVALLTGLLVLNLKATEHVTAWILERPVLHLRIFAVGQIVLGLLMLFGLARERRKAGEAPYKKRLVSFEGGMTAVPRILASQLEKELVCGARVTSVEKPDALWRVTWEKGGERFTEEAEGLVIAVPAYELPRLALPEPVAEKLSVLSTLPYSPVTTVCIGCAREAVAHPLDGFGVLVPRRETRGVIGILFLSSMFAGRAPDGYVAMLAFVGGMACPQQAALPEMDVKALVKAEMGRLLGLRGVPVFESVQRWPKAIPHFPVGWQKALDAVAQVERETPGLVIAGNYLGSPATGETLLRANDAALRLLATGRAG